jgi:hypothetical protein
LRSRCRAPSPDWSATACRCRNTASTRADVPARAHRSGCGRHGHEQHRPPRAPGVPRTGAPPCLAEPGPHRPCQRSAERCREGQHAPLLVGQQGGTYLVRVPGRGTCHRQSRGLRLRPHPARCGAAQGSTASRAQHRASPAAASALGRQHQVGEVPPALP